MKDNYSIADDNDRLMANAYLTPDVLEDQAGRNTWTVNRIQVLTTRARGEGWGTKLLEQICAEADAEGANLMLGVSPDEPRYFRRLVAWYRRHGFVPYKRRTVSPVHNLMMRWSGR